jgi:phenylpropionate dioxygenase-like ring-hydroxylating dioxygenase large terminal subunit
MNSISKKEYTELTQDDVGDPRAFQRLLAEETVPVPEFLNPTHPGFGDEDLPIWRYTAHSFHRLEAEKMWPKVWQFVGRAEQIPNAGDNILYDIIDHSVVVMRGDDGVIRGFHNSCLHRGRALRTTGGTASMLKCPYHGFTWDVCGKFKSLPSAWDFCHVKNQDLSLPQVRVETWGGFVFINLDNDAEPLLDYLGVLPDHFKSYLFDRSYIQAHVQRKIPCNWKVAQEAFMESMHTRATHPQIMTFTGCLDSQYDIYGDNISRTITPMGVVGPHLKGVSQELVLHDILKESGRMASSDADKYKLPEGMTARQYVGELNREIFGAAAGVDLGQATLAELEDAILYSVFPNTQIWAGFGSNIVYRVIPDGDNQESCLFDVMILGRYAEGAETPTAAKLTRLADDAPFSDAPEIGALGAVFDQDMRNLPYMMKGLKASKKGKVSLASYQESRIRHHHITLDKYLGLAEVR